MCVRLGVYDLGFLGRLGFETRLQRTARSVGKCLSKIPVQLAAHRLPAESMGNSF